VDECGFAAVRTENIWFMYQVTSAVKPIPAKDAAIQAEDRQYMPAIDNNGWGGIQLLA
jgi:hypothetical protein